MWQLNIRTIFFPFANPTFAIYEPTTNQKVDWRFFSFSQRDWEIIQLFGEKFVRRKQNSNDARRTDGHNILWKWWHKAISDLAHNSMNYTFKQYINRAPIFSQQIPRIKTVKILCDVWRDCAIKRRKKNRRTEKHINCYFSQVMSFGFDAKISLSYDKRYCNDNERFVNTLDLHQVTINQ